MNSSDANEFFEGVKREGMQPHWIAYAVLDNIAVCFHTNAHDGYCVCIQYHPPMCAVGVPDSREYTGHDRAEGQRIFDELAEGIRRGELADVLRDGR